MATDDHGARLGTWLELVRRARLPQDLKLAALTFASYAGANGSGIVCSVSRLAVDVDVTYAAARKLLARLRDLGLVEMTKRGNRRRGWTDEYRLIVHPDLLERLDLPNPEAYRKLIGEASKAENRATAERARRYRERKRERAAAENNAHDTAEQERYNDAPAPVDNPEIGEDSPEEVTPPPGGDGALDDGITPKTSRNNARPCAPDLRRSSDNLPYIDLARNNNLPYQVDELSLERTGSSGPPAATRTEDVSQMADELDEAYREARAALSALADKGVALRAHVRAELGADAPPREVVIVAADRFRRSAS